MEVIDQIKAYLENEGCPASARWISRHLNMEQRLVSNALRRLVRAGIAKVQLRIEFDFVFNHKFNGNIACKRRRNYYWVDSPPKPKKQRRKKH